jgi:hypothetical protein
MSGGGCVPLTKQPKKQSKMEQQVSKLNQQTNQPKGGVFHENKRNQ